MKLLLLIYLTVVLHTALGSLPAPLNLSVSSVNFKYLLRWKPGLGSPPGVKYEVYKRCHKARKLLLATTEETWAEVILNHSDIHTLCVRSSFNNSQSQLSSIISFFPYLQTNITAPNVTMSGCGTCIRMNIFLPRPHHTSEIQDIRQIYRSMRFNISLRKKGQENVVPIETENQTVVIEHLLPGSEYCIRVKPVCPDITFEPSPWKCVFTSTVRPPQVSAVVGVVAVLAMLGLSALVLVLVGLQYTGIICKLKEALPHTLITTLSHRSPLSLERTVPEPVSFIPERGQPSSYSLHSSSDEEEEEDQEESGAQYMDRGADLSSGFSSSGGHVTTSSQSATVVNSSGSLSERIDEQEEEKAQSIKVEDLPKKETGDSEKPEEWEEVWQSSGNVNLFSVTLAALDFHREDDPQQSDVEPLLPTDPQTQTSSDSLLPQQQEYSDVDEEETELSSYMCH